MKITRETYLSLGSNQGNKLQNLQAAIHFLVQYTGHISRISSVYQTRAWGFEAEDFYNICVTLTTSLSPEELLERILEIEQKLGRVRKNDKKYSSRTIDIDILLFEDEVIFSPNLIVPHPRMAERKFVLVPLAEIAGQIKHPIKKISINACLAQCTDETEVQKTDARLDRPLALFEKYNYIAIEGNIGSGKTSLAKKLGDDFNAKLVLERFADNPFLPKFYEDQERFAFPLEMSFLADRYQQLSDGLAQFDLFKNFIVSDYYIFKSLIFAQVTLPAEEYKLYRKMFDILYKEIIKPDIYVFLHQSTDGLLQNIKKRGRVYEQNIESAYLDSIQTAYINFIKSDESIPKIIIEVSDLDFIENREDYLRIVSKIAGA